MDDVDIPEILAIEQNSYQFPWSEGIIRDCLKTGYFFYSWIEQEEIIGYGVLSCAANEAHLLNLCVRSDRRGEGIGRGLLDHLLSIASRQSIDTVFLEVRASNMLAIQLYENNGFNQIGCRKDYYPAEGGREDALVFAKALIP
ncbi:MAG: ribosomal-protein-alanine N-acetyltransferase [Gammaproteobacteria bacterium]|nr:MAG: ribosomal-protein-alanine N-acetyltransferase [Gammaproteobacteria bacterium]